MGLIKDRVYGEGKIDFQKNFFIMYVCEGIQINFIYLVGIKVLFQFVVKMFVVRFVFMSDVYLVMVLRDYGVSIIYFIFENEVVIFIVDSILVF